MAIKGMSSTVTFVPECYYLNKHLTLPWVFSKCKGSMPDEVAWSNQKTSSYSLKKSIMFGVYLLDLGSPEGIALDHLGRNIFWTDSQLDRIEVAG